MLFFEKCQNLIRTRQYRRGYACQPGDVNAIALIGPARHDLIEKDDFALSFANGHAGVSEASHLLVRRHLKTGELAFHYCYVPEGQLLTKTRLIRAAGLRWPVEEDFRLGKDSLGLDQCQARLYTAIQRHIVLVMAALAICAVTAAWLKDRTDAQASPPVTPGQTPPPDPGMIPLTVPEIKRLLAAVLSRATPAVTPPAGSPGDAATRHDPDGSTSAHD